MTQEPTPIDFADVRVGMKVRQTWPDGTTIQGVVTTQSPKVFLIGVAHQVWETADEALILHLIAPAPTPPMSEPLEWGARVLCDNAGGEVIRAAYGIAANDRAGTDSWIGKDARRYCWSDLRNPRPVPATMTEEEVLAVVEAIAGQFTGGVIFNGVRHVNCAKLASALRAAFAAKQDGGEQG